MLPVPVRTAVGLGPSLYFENQQATPVPMPSFSIVSWTSGWPPCCSCAFATCARSLLGRRCARLRLACFFLPNVWLVDPVFFFPTVRLRGLVERLGESFARAAGRRLVGLSSGWSSRLGARVLFFFLCRERRTKKETGLVGLSEE